MDSLTHVVLGAVTGELIAGKKLGRQAIFWGALANSLPDIDVGCMAYMTVPHGLLAHRGFTHSFVFAALAAPLLGFAFSKLKKNAEHTFKLWTLFFLIQLSLHCVIDVLTAYGTALIEPFSHRRYALDILFVADPLFTLPLLIAFVAQLVLKSTSAKRIIWLRGGIFLSSLYLLFAFFSKAQVNTALQKNLSEQHITNSGFFTTPTPFNTFLWYVVVKQDSGFKTAHYSILDREDRLEFNFFPRNDSLAASLPDREAIETLIRFSQGYYCLRMEKDTLVFSDLRFGQLGGWYKPDAPGVFRYNLEPEAGNTSVIQNGRAQASTTEALSELKNRIFRDRH